eukprot:scaffold122660_cov44-Attheya_sp.AAC.2
MDCTVGASMMCLPTLLNGGNGGGVFEMTSSPRGRFSTLAEKCRHDPCGKRRVIIVPPILDASIIVTVYW